MSEKIKGVYCTKRAALITKIGQRKFRNIWKKRATPDLKEARHGEMSRRKSGRVLLRTFCRRKSYALQKMHESDRVDRLGLFKIFLAEEKLPLQKAWYNTNRKI